MYSTKGVRPHRFSGAKELYELLGRFGWFPSGNQRVMTSTNLVHAPILDTLQYEQYVQYSVDLSKKVDD